MDEDTEVLDWGQEDDEQNPQRPSADGWRDPEDAEDAVSLGGDDDDMQDFYAYQTADQDSSAKSQHKPPSGQHLHQNRRDHQQDFSGGSPNKIPTHSQGSTSPSLQRAQSLGKLIHALPPKPVVAVAPFIHTSPTQTSTLASSMVQRDRRPNGHGKAGSTGNSDALPPDWEIRYPRDGAAEQYYYNVKTHESTWTRPGSVSRKSSPSKDRENGSVHVRESRSPGPSEAQAPARVRAHSIEGHATVHPNRKDPKEAMSLAEQLSYKDRHYRPGSEGNDTSEKRVGRPFLPDGPYRATSPRLPTDRRRSRSFTPPPKREHVDRPTRRELSPPRLPLEHEIRSDWSPQHILLMIVPANVLKIWTSMHPLILATMLTSGRPQVRYSPHSPAPYRRSFSSRGGGRVVVDVSRSLGSRDSLFPFSLFCTRHKDAHDGPSFFFPLSCTLFDTFPYFSFHIAGHRSPRPRVRDFSPSGSRRFTQDKDTSGLPPPMSNASAPGGFRQTSRYDRPTNFAMPPPSQSYSREDAIYTRTDSVPQRRGRDDGADSSSESESKRRRLDERLADPPSRQMSMSNTAAPPGLPERPVPSSFPPPVNQIDQSRSRKRPPLPPQSARFREVATRPDSFPPPSPGTDSGRESFTEPLSNSNVPPRFADTPSDMSSSRRPFPLYSTRDVEPHVPNRPAAVAARPGSRFDHPPHGQARDYPPRADRDNMDVDPPSIRAPPSRPPEGPARAGPAMYADRLGMDVQADLPPRGPRAMTNKTNPPPSASPQTSPSSTYPNLRLGHFQEPPSTLSRGRMRPSPSSHTGNEGWTERRDRQDGPTQYAAGSTSSPHFYSRRLDDDRTASFDHLEDRRVSTRNVNESTLQDARPRDPSMRYPPRSADTALAPQSAPVVGNKNEDRDLLPSPISQHRPPNGPPRGRAEGGGTASRDEFGRMGPPPYPVTGSASSNSYRPSPSDNAASGRHRSLSNVDRDERPQRSHPRNADDYRGSGPPTSVRSNSVYEPVERPARQTRFGPKREPSRPPPSDPVEEPRVWITREEVQSRENRSREVQSVDGPHIPHDARSSRGDNAPWQASESAAPYRYNNPSNPNRQNLETRLTPAEEPSRSRRSDFPSTERGRDRANSVDTRLPNRPPTLEGRISSHYDRYPAEGPYRGSNEPSLLIPSRPRDQNAYSASTSRPDHRDPREAPPLSNVGGRSWDRADPGGFREPSPSGPLTSDHPRPLRPSPASTPFADEDLMRPAPPGRILHSDRTRPPRPSSGHTPSVDEDLVMRSALPGRIPHSDRTRPLRPPPAPTPVDEDSFMRTSKPVRIRRPPPAPTKPSHDSPEGDETNMPRESARDDRPVEPVEAYSEQMSSRPMMARRGGSLLDRLSLNDLAPPPGDGPSPSLRDRVEIYSNGPNDDMDVAREDAALDVDLDSSMGDSLRGMRGGKKRSLKPKRGRRGGLLP
ncbi:uncharacterized protein FIBRA_00031 [Fibroporia radiculosa]|uniref:WW domain-containing protein n=1 Tax=Fibroporia radiculosa TaxID=599839 RepID=J7RG05_9APHY|nr:uncharacterized protein FIBRA_00031 [Fibroporia radiculosa]CCL98037.1 predicted protein [Fibroporia radiculosa]